MTKKIITAGLITAGLTSGAYAYGGNTQVTVDDSFNTTNYNETIKENSLSAALVALSSVELNPDHEGWSVGVGAGYDDLTEQYGAAAGVGYGFDRNSTGGYAVGANLKAYDCEGGNYGVGVGLTVGF